MLFNFVLFLSLLLNALVVSAAPIKDSAIAARSANVEVERVFSAGFERVSYGLSCFL